ncbi:hypothetical protein [Jiangella anatolica]|uniref:hypothetical protein n=1 Tax=Jiangella anatolica TaxID=2670374 RepID=UPI0018F5206B|nr:hypothetical protein [Jiangella anatolica]
MSRTEIPRRFALRRDRDRSGVSGTGIVAYGTAYAGGAATLAWCSGPVRSVTVFASVDDIEQIHGHGGDSVVVWLDPGATDEEPVTPWPGPLLRCPPDGFKSR